VKEIDYSESAGKTVTPRTLRLGNHQYPVILPSILDPRLHLAAVIVSIHVLGQVVLGFQVSVVQILAAILTCAVIEVVWTFNRSRLLAWPASAILTGSSVGLILRVIGTENGDYWSWRGWYLFSLVAGLSLLTKYVIRYRGSHVFNPSNVGLVVAFIVLGSTRVAPLDFWWGPLDGWMAAAYLIILVGGLLITARLRLLAMAVAFWITLGAGIGVLAASGHCITARWAFGPVCGSHFWWVIVTSPEVLIFLFFMITDPKTVPAGRVARMVFGACVALAGTLLIAPQTTEFGAKVALLAGLVVMCPARLLFGGLLPAAKSEQDRLRLFVARLATSGGINAGFQRGVARGAIAVSAVVFLAVGIIAAGAPARGSQETGADVSPALAVEIDPSTLPRVTVDADVTALNSDLAGPGAQDLAVTLAENLEIETEALLRADQSLLTAVDSGDRLSEMQRRIDEAVSTGKTVVAHYTFDSLHLSLVFAYGSQGGAGLGLEARGTLEEVAYDAEGNESDRTTSPCALTFVFRQAAGDRWLIVEVLPLA
jgi:hypothetical protein